jgi:hypothetical protein
MYEYEDHRDWAEHLDDIGMLDRDHIPCLMASRCVADVESEASEMSETTVDDA